MGKMKLVVLDAAGGQAIIYPEPEDVESFLVSEGFRLKDLDYLLTENIIYKD